jgi:hypothetical protein
MKHIILPTDFHILSLQPIHDVMARYGNEPIRFTLLHLLEMPSGIGDLLFRTGRPGERFKAPAHFLEACEVLANRYEHRIDSIRVVTRYGSTAAYLENLINGMDAYAVAVQKGYREQSFFPESVPMIPLLYRCDCLLLETPLAAVSPDYATAGTIGDLLHAAY